MNTRPGNEARLSPHANEKATESWVGLGNEANDDYVLLDTFTRAVNLFFNVIGYHYNQELYASISEIFRQYLSKSRQRDQENPPTSTSSWLNNERQTEPTFTPRLVPLDSLLTGPTAPCREYEQLPTSTKRVHLTDIQLSHSMQFLLQVGSELIDITVEELYSSLLMVEASFQKRTLIPLQRAFEL